MLDEIDDLFSEKDQSVAIVLKSKSLTLRTPKGRRKGPDLWTKSSVSRSPGILNVMASFHASLKPESGHADLFTEA